MLQKRTVRILSFQRDGSVFLLNSIKTISGRNNKHLINITYHEDWHKCLPHFTETRLTKTCFSIAQVLWKEFNFCQYFTKFPVFISNSFWIAYTYKGQLQGLSNCSGIWKFLLMQSCFYSHSLVLCSQNGFIITAEQNVLILSIATTEKFFLHFRMHIFL